MAVSRDRVGSLERCAVDNKLMASLGFSSTADVVAYLHIVTDCGICSLRGVEILKGPRLLIYQTIQVELLCEGSS